MKKCENCGRNYSDMVMECPACGTQLLPKEEHTSTSTSTSDHTPKFTSVPPKSSGSKIAKILWWAVAVMALLCMALLDASLATMAGAVCFGLVIGLIPRAVAKKRNKEGMGEIAWAAVTLVNTLFGMYGSIPAAIIFIIIAFT